MKNAVKVTQAGGPSLHGGFSMKDSTRTFKSGSVLDPPRDNFNLLPDLRDLVFAENAAPLRPGINDGFSPDDRTGRQYAVAAELCLIAHNGPKFSQSGRHNGSIRFNDTDRGMIQLHV